MFYKAHAEDMAAITTLELKNSSFFDQCDPGMVKWLGNRRSDVS